MSAPKSSSSTTGSSGLFVLADERPPRAVAAPSGSPRGSRCGTRALSSTIATPSTANAHDRLLDRGAGGAASRCPRRSRTARPARTARARRRRPRSSARGRSRTGARRRPAASARRPPRKSSPWLPVSATEWIASASSDAAPVTAKATNFATAIPRLARNAATIARRLPSCMDARQPAAVSTDQTETARIEPALAVRRARRTQRWRPARTPRTSPSTPSAQLEVVTAADRQCPAASEVQPLVPSVVRAPVGRLACGAADADTLSRGNEAAERVGAFGADELERGVDQDAGEGAAVVRGGRPRGATPSARARGARRPWCGSGAGA